MRTPATQSYWLYNDKGEAVPLFVVEGGKVTRPASAYEKEQWTRWDELKANSPGIMGGLGLLFVSAATAYRIAEKIGVNGWWGPLALGVTLVGIGVYYLVGHFCGKAEGEKS